MSKRDGTTSSVLCSVWIIMVYSISIRLIRLAWHYQRRGSNQAVIGLADNHRGLFRDSHLENLRLCLCLCLSPSLCLCLCVPSWSSRRMQLQRPTPTSRPTRSMWRWVRTWSSTRTRRACWRSTLWTEKPGPTRYPQSFYGSVDQRLTDDGV